LDRIGQKIDWVVGISIGAINAAVIAGNRSEDLLPQPGRPSKLQSLWNDILWPPSECLSPWSKEYDQWLKAWSAICWWSPLAPLVGKYVGWNLAAWGGQRNFFRSRLLSWENPWLAEYWRAPLPPRDAANYDTAPLCDLLKKYVDWKRINMNRDSIRLSGCELMSSVSDPGGIPTERENMVIVAAVNNVLHFRIFDGKGNVVEDTDETRLTGQTRQIEDLKKQLERLWPPHQLTGSEKEQVIAAVISIVGHTRLSLGATDVETGEMRFFSSFDSRATRSSDSSEPAWKKVNIGADHVMASGALPPAFPPVPIDEDNSTKFYWDGGLFSNTPLQELQNEFYASLFDLRMYSLNDISEVPTKGEDLIIVAAVNNMLHFRIFDGEGKRVVDTDEQKLPEQARQIEDLRKQLESLWSPHELTGSDRQRVIAAVTSIVSYREKPTVIFDVLVWDRKGLVPRTMDESMWRQKCIQFGSRKKVAELIVENYQYIRERQPGPSLCICQVMYEYWDGFDLRLVRSINDISDIPAEEKDLIIVAEVNNVLHFRIFDGEGKRVVDTDEQRLPEQARQIEDLRKQLESLWPPPQADSEREGPSYHCCYINRRLHPVGRSLGPW
jgi:predicted acylesterase/phospholipase RssA